jgi:hypothetical protein
LGVSPLSCHVTTAATVASITTAPPSSVATSRNKRRIGSHKRVFLITFRFAKLFFNFKTIFITFHIAHAIIELIIAVDRTSEVRFSSLTKFTAWFVDAPGKNTNHQKYIHEHKITNQDMADNTQHTC